MKKFRSILWGLVFIAVGVIIALKVLNIVDVEIFFDGWWTLLIIVPCFIGIFTEQNKFGNILGVGIGVFLLLCCQDILEFSMLWKLGVPVLLVVIGVKMIFGGIFKNKSNEVIKSVKADGINMQRYSALFSGNDVNYSSEMFNGAEVNAVFGGATLDLRTAFIDRDCVIKANAIFGGIDIFVPEGVNVKVHSTSIFGGASDEKKQNHPDNPHTIFVNAVCIFGGVDIK